MEACRVLIHFGPFWASIRDLKQMGLLIRTCKTLRAECDVVFAVRAMGKDKNIKKIWATLWLGIANGWMRTIENFTLSMALEIVAVHGGLKATSQRAIASRQKKHDAMIAKREARMQMEEHERQLMLVRDRMNDIYAELNRNDVHGSLNCLADAINQAAEDTSVAIDDDLLARLKGIREQHLRKEQQKRADADERVSQFKLRMQNKGFHFQGFYYERMQRDLRRSKVEITDDDIALIGFKDAVGETREFAKILKELTKSRGRKFKGMYAEARGLFCQMYEMGPDGVVLEKPH